MDETLATITTTILLERLRSPEEQEVWEEFDSRIRPVLIRVGKQLGLSEADAEDSAQETLAQFIRDYREGRYDRQKGRLRAWIISICRHRVMDICRRRARSRGWRGESAMVNLADENHISRIWMEEQRAILFEKAFDRLSREGKFSGRTIRVFEMVAVKRISPSLIADTMRISIAEVYRAKNRVTTRMREIAAELSDLYEAEYGS